jgi:hypothetical protein
MGPTIHYIFRLEVSFTSFHTSLGQDIFLRQEYNLGSNSFLPEVRGDCYA